MSHVEICAVVITDLPALKKACETLGVTFVEGQKTFKSWSTQYGTGENHCEHAIKVPGTSWEVGLLKADTPANSDIGSGVAESVKSGGKNGFSPAFDAYGTEGQAIASKLCKQQPNGLYTHEDGKHYFETLMDQYSVEVLKSKARMKGWQFQQKTVNGVIKLEVKLPN